MFQVIDGIDLTCANIWRLITSESSAPQMYVRHAFGTNRAQLFG
jgi:hypothetical protein